MKCGGSWGPVKVSLSDAPRPGPPAAERPTQFRWVVFALSCSTSWLLYFHRYVFALIKPELTTQWNLSKSQLGLLDSAFSTFYSGFQLPLGIAADALGVHLVLSGLIILWSIGLGLHAWDPAGPWMWYARALLGIGQSAVFACLSRISKSWFPASVRTTVQGWVGVFFGRMGGLGANVIVGSLLLGLWQLPWRATVVGLAIVGAAFGAAFALLFRNRPEHHPWVNSAEAALIAGAPRGAPAESTDSTPAQARPGSAQAGPSGGKLGVRQLLSRMSPRAIVNLLVVNLQTILSTLADNIYSAWIPLFLFEVHQLEFKKMGLYSALPLLGGALGGALGGWLNDLAIVRLGNRRWGRSLVGLSGKGVAGILLLAALLWYDSPEVFCGMLFFVKFFSDWSLTTTWGTVTDIGGRVSASVFAYNNAVAGVGSIVAPLIYGPLADFFGWRPVFYTAAGTYLACALTWLAIDCTRSVFPEARFEFDKNGADGS